MFISLRITNYFLLNIKRKTMKRKFLPFAALVAIFFSATWLTSCSDDDDDDNPPYNGTGAIAFENVVDVKDYVQSGTFKRDGAQPAILPGQTHSFTFNAAKGQYLTFATMYGNSNDLFFAPENPGIALFTSDGTPVTGDVSGSVKLWDNGTRVNQAPGANVNHPGTAENNNVLMIVNTDGYGHSYLPASDLMKLNLTYNKSRSEFTLTITNNSGGTANETPFSPGVWAVSNVWKGDVLNKNPFFTADQKSGTQLTALAEGGNNAPLYEMIQPMTGIITGLSPAVVVIYTGDVNPIYELNKKDAGIGLSALAQTGSTTQLVESLKRMSNVRHVYTTGSDVIGPGEKKEVVYDALRGDKIAYATMFGYSNDWFYSNSSVIDAFTKGDVTNKTVLLDNGTAINQYPGAGNLQASFGGTSEPEDKEITSVGNTYPVPAVDKVIKVVIR